MTNQCMMIIDYMKRNGSITSAEAMKELGVFRLASRIHDIRKSGVLIAKETVSGVNRFGEKTNFAKYSIVKED